MTHQETAPSFASFGFSEEILQGLQEADFKVPSSIQQEVIPHIMSGKDLIGQAQTGTGKTGAFGLPALYLMQQNPAVQMLVMAPTRELAKQVSDEIFRFGRRLGIKTATICGGKSFKGQIESIQSGVRVLVATPGRLLDLFSSGKLPNFHPSIVVLDEADEMLDMGFLDDITQIFTFLPKKRQTLLFSATMPISIRRLAEKILQDPLHIKAQQKETVNLDIEQFYYMIREEERDQAIIRLIDCENPEKAVIFCRTKKEVDRLAQFFVEAGYPARGLHGDMEQGQREEVIRGFRSEHVRFLIATDVAARGLNISNISHVFNYHPPFDTTNYVHRIGRTGRAGKKGIASTFLTRREWSEFQRFEKVLGTKIQKGTLPTFQDVVVAKRRHLVDRIMAQKIHEDAKYVLQMMPHIDEKDLIAKLLSLVVGDQPILGPDQIGTEIEEFQDRRSNRREGGREGRSGRRFGRQENPPPSKGRGFREKSTRHVPSSPKKGGAPRGKRTAV